MEIEDWEATVSKMNELDIQMSIMWVSGVIIRLAPHIMLQVAWILTTSICLSVKKINLQSRYHHLPVISRPSPS